MADMTAPVQLQFHCNVCASELTDADAVFTSCGHFFCPRCTRIQPGSSGTCEICGTDADSGSLAGRGLSYNEHVRTFVFGDPVEEIKKIAEMVKFHQIHSGLFSKAVRRRAQEHAKLRDELQKITLAYRHKENELKRLQTDFTTMKRQVQCLAAENSILKKDLASARPRDSAVQGSSRRSEGIDHGAYGTAPARSAAKNVPAPLHPMRLSLGSRSGAPGNPGRDSRTEHVIPTRSFSSRSRVIGSAAPYRSPAEDKALNLPARSSSIPYPTFGAPHRMHAYPNPFSS